MTTKTMGLLWALYFGVCLVWPGIMISGIERDDLRAHDMLVTRLASSLEKIQATDQEAIPAGVCRWSWRYNEWEKIRNIRKAAGNFEVTPSIDPVFDKFLLTQMAMVTDRYLKAMRALYSASPMEAVSCYGDPKVNLYGHNIETWQRIWQVIDDSQLNAVHYQFTSRTFKK